MVRAKKPESSNTQVDTLTEKFSALKVTESPEYLKLSEKYDHLVELAELQRQMNSKLTITVNRLAEELEQTKGRIVAAQPPVPQSSPSLRYRKWHLYFLRRRQ